MEDLNKGGIFGSINVPHQSVSTWRDGHQWNIQGLGTKQKLGMKNLTCMACIFPSLRHKLLPTTQ